MTNGEAYVKFSEMARSELVSAASRHGYDHDEEMARSELRARLAWERSEKSLKSSSVFAFD